LLFYCGAAAAAAAKAAAEAAAAKAERQQKKQQRSRVSGQWLLNWANYLWQSHESTLLVFSLAYLATDTQIQI